jgi:hypothetical protein
MSAHWSLMLLLLRVLDRMPSVAGIVNMSFGAISRQAGPGRKIGGTFRRRCSILVFESTNELVANDFLSGAPCLGVNGWSHDVIYIYIYIYGHYIVSAFGLFRVVSLGPMVLQILRRWWWVDIASLVFFSYVLGIIGDWLLDRCHVRWSLDGGISYVPRGAGFQVPSSYLGKVEIPMQVPHMWVLFSRTFEICLFSLVVELDCGGWYWV